MNHHLSHLSLSPPDLWQELTNLIEQIPPGRVTTFGHLAKVLGNRQAVRWIGSALRHDERKHAIPWYRVVRADGATTPGLTRLGDTAETMLINENLRVIHGKVDLLKSLFIDFQCSAPLAQLSIEQSQLKSLVNLDDPPAPPEKVAGIDISYADSSTAIGAYVEYDLYQHEITFEQTMECEIHFPFISGYLAYREIPVYDKLLTEVTQQRTLADIFLVDGSGIIHPHQFGIACHLGVLFNHPTVGISKKLLFGQRNRSNADKEVVPIESQGKFLGYEIKKSNRSLFVSPGHGISHNSALDIVNSCWRSHRLIEPVHRADSLSRKLSRQFKHSREPGIAPEPVTTYH